MTRTERSVVVSALVRLAAVTRGAAMDDLTLAAYLDALDDLDPADVANACADLARSATWFPAAAEIRAAAVAPAKAAAAAAWVQVCQLVHAQPSLVWTIIGNDAAANAALRKVGGLGVVRNRRAVDDAAMRANFEAAYLAAKTDATKTLEPPR